MFATGTGAPVLTAYNNLVHTLMGSLRELRLVHHKVCYGLVVGIITKVMHKSITVELRITGSESKITCGNDVICIIVVNLDGNTS